MAIASVPLANSQHSFALCQHLMDSVTGMNYSWYLWYCGIREKNHECLKWSSEKYGINIPANKTICQKYRFLLQYWCSTHWRRGRRAIIDTAANHGDSFLPLCPLIPKWMVRELLQKPSNCQFVCDDTDTKITITSSSSSLSPSSRLHQQQFYVTEMAWQACPPILSANPASSSIKLLW